MEIGNPNSAEASSGRNQGLVSGWVWLYLLCTDLLLIAYSGGIRGIVELQVLREVERKLGGKIKIQDFFDLIVGTRFLTSLLSSMNVAKADFQTVLEASLHLV